MFFAWNSLRFDLVLVLRDRRLDVSNSFEVVRAIETRVCGDPLLWPDVYQDLHLSVFPASLYRL
jgi:hypothetical protein